MVNRISTTGRYAQMVSDMQRNLFNYNKLTKQLAANSKITSITDDPIAAVNILNTNRQLGQIGTFSQNVEMAMSELSSLDDLMELATGYLSQAWDKATQANNQTYGETSLKALKIEIDEITKTMVDLANTEYDNNYIFAGANTKTIPYEITENGNIIYKGTPHNNPDYIRSTEVSDGVFEVINTTGDKVFGYFKAYYETPTGEVVIKNSDGTYSYEAPEIYADDPALLVDTGKRDGDGYHLYKDANGKIVVGKDGVYEYQEKTPYTGAEEDLVYKEESDGVMSALKKLSNSIQKVLDGDTVEGYNEMQETLDLFSSSLNTILNEQTKFGGVYNRLEMTTSALETNNENLTAYLSQVKDIDYAEAVSNWLQAQYAYQASLQISSSTMNLSLLNYL